MAKKSIENPRSFVRVSSLLDGRFRSDADASVEEVVRSLGAEGFKNGLLAEDRREEAIADGSGGFKEIGIGVREREADCWYEDFGEREEVQDSRWVWSLMMAAQTLGSEGAHGGAVAQHFHFEMVKKLVLMILLRSLFRAVALVSDKGDVLAQRLITK